MKQKRLTAKIKKSAVAVGIACACFFGASSPSHAFVEVDPFFNAWATTVYSAFVEEVDNQFFAINTYLAEANDTLTATYRYLNNGDGDTGKGVIGTINKIWAEQRPYMENMSGQQSSWAKRNMLDALPGQTIMNKMPDPRNCSELPTKMASRAMGGGGGTARARSKTETKVAEKQAGTAASDVSNAADVYGAHIDKYCTKQDVSFDGSAKEAFGKERNAFNCTTPGPMPDADARVQSIFIPAHDYVKAGDGDASQIGSAHSLTFDPDGRSKDQSDAADASISNMVASFSPPAMGKGVEQTPAGRLYLAKVKVFNERVSPAVMALASIKAARDAVTGWDQGVQASAQGSGSIFDNWTQNAQSVYKNVFPAGTPLPKKPSSAELMRFEVFRRYFDFGENSWVNKLQIATPEQVNVEVAETLALNAYLQYQTFQQNELTNSLLSALLSQSVNQITKQDLQTSAQQANRTK